MARRVRAKRRSAEGCLAAARLISVGVRCVEVTLDGWDSHVNNHEVHKGGRGRWIPRFAALLRYLQEHQLLESTVVLWGANSEEPRKSIRWGAAIIGHTDLRWRSRAAACERDKSSAKRPPIPPMMRKTGSNSSKIPRPIADIHATVMHTLGVSFEKELLTPVGRPMKLCEGKLIPELLTDPHRRKLGAGQSLPKLLAEHFRDLAALGHRFLELDEVEGL